MIIPAELNSLILSILWGMWIVPCIPIAKLPIHAVAIIASHMAGIMYMFMIVGGSNEEPGRMHVAALRIVGRPELFSWNGIHAIATPAMMISNVLYVQ